MDSYALFKQADRLVKDCGTRDALQIAEEIGIKVYYEDSFTDLLGMYTFRWNHRLMFLNLIWIHTSSRWWQLMKSGTMQGTGIWRSYKG